MAALQKSTDQYAHHGIPLECDIYETVDCKNDAPVFLFFHSGGLVGGNRTFIPPWLVQTCYDQKWPLISASYRLVPPIGGRELLEDVIAAYQYARKLNNVESRPVIVGGASAGFFMAGLAAHHLQPPPVALLSITGIPTFHHPFFNSSIQLTPDLIPRSEVKHFFNEPVMVGSTPKYHPSTFFPAMLRASSSARFPDFVHPQAPIEKSVAEKEIEKRDSLYDYFLYENAFGDIVGDVDPDFDWALERGDKWKAWPTTIFIQGDADVDVDKDVCVSAAEKLGEKARFFMAEGQQHLFEATSFLEEETAAMDTVKAAIAELKSVVSQASEKKI